jgi:Mrp family chromosome partitioning ATPase
MSPDPLTANVVPPRVVFGVPATVSASVRDRALVRMLSPQSLDFEPFRVLRTKVKALREQRLPRCLGLVSATGGEGTSAVALGLAAALAQEPETRVLLVDAALRTPTLEKSLGLPNEPGLSEWLEPSADRPVPLRRVEPWGFLLLSAGAPAADAAERLGSERMGRLLSAARAFDYVLLDCPPLETVADSVVLQDLIDGFLLVVRARHASRDTIRRALSHLRPEAVHGVVFNDRTDILARWLDRRRPRSTS